MNAQRICEPVAYVGIDFRNYSENGIRMIAYVCWLSKYAPIELFKYTIRIYITKKVSVDSNSSTITQGLLTRKF